MKNHEFKIVVIKPNSDPGSNEILNTLKVFGKSTKDKMVFCNNLKSDLFINLIRNSFCIAGNSSMGLLETSYYEKFALNIGSRQKGD